MQVNKGPWEVGANMEAGVKLLREYYLRLGSVKAAVIAYNVGPGKYLRGEYKLKYWKQYEEVRNAYVAWLHAGAHADQEGSDPAHHLGGARGYRNLDLQGNADGLCLRLDWRSPVYPEGWEFGIGLTDHQDP